MRQLYDKSGSAARFSDFALDVRKVVAANTLPEYTLDLSKNDEGDEIIRMLRRNLLPVNDPRFELTRGKRRRHGTGIRQKALRFT
jgi:hypothetical protein